MGGAPICFFVIHTEGGARQIRHGDLPHGCVWAAVGAV